MKKDINIKSYKKSKNRTGHTQKKIIEPEQSAKKQAKKTDQGLKGINIQSKS